METRRQLQIQTRADGRILAINAAGEISTSSLEAEDGVTERRQTESGKTERFFQI